LTPERQFLYVRAQNVEQGHSGVDQRLEHLLATAAGDVGNVALQVLVPLERRLPHPLLGIHARLGPELHGGSLVLVVAPAVMLLGEPPLGTRHPPHEVSHPPYAVAAVTHSMEATSTTWAATAELESEERPEKTVVGCHDDGAVGEHGRQRHGARREAIGERRVRLGGRGVQRQP